MKKKKRLKLAQKALDDFCSSPYILGKLKTILMMEDCRDKDVIKEFRKLVIERHERIEDYRYERKNKRNYAF